jgi:hypothetical protein
VNVVNRVEREENVVNRVEREEGECGEQIRER